MVKREDHSCDHACNRTSLALLHNRLDTMHGIRMDSLTLAPVYNLAAGTTAHIRTFVQDGGGFHGGHVLQRLDG